MGRHNQMDAERTSALCNIDHAVNKLRHFARESRKLVDHEHKRRWSIGIAALLQLQQILGFLAIEQVFAVMQLSPQARQCTAHQVGAQVSDEANAVRQRDTIGESRAALVVNKEEGHTVRAIFRCHAQHPGLQEL